MKNLAKQVFIVLRNSIIFAVIVFALTAVISFIESIGSNKYDDYIEVEGELEGAVEHIEYYNHSDIGSDMRTIYDCSYAITVDGERYTAVMHDLPSKYETYPLRYPPGHPEQVVVADDAMRKEDIWRFNYEIAVPFTLFIIFAYVIGKPLMWLFWRRVFGVGKNVQ